MNLNTLLDLAIMIFAGMFCGRMAKHVHLPNVTGYLVAGLLIGPSVFGLLSEDFLTTINIISDVALGFIAFSIGNEFKMSYFSVSVLRRSSSRASNRCLRSYLWCSAC